MILYEDLEGSVYECVEGVCGNTRDTGDLCSKGSGDLFRWGVLGGQGWQWYAVAHRLCYVRKCG